MGEEAGALAVVSAIIIVQVTSWQTVRRGVERILGVIIGVGLAVLVTRLVSLNFVTMVLMIFCAQIVGMFLQKRGQYLANQVPISAALALSLGMGGGDYPLLRIMGAVVGALVGAVISLLFSLPIYAFRMRDELAKLMMRLADGIPELVNALSGSPDEAERHAVYTHMRTLEQEVHATERALSLALDSARINPWARSIRRSLIDYPDMLLALDRLVRQMRRIGYTIDEAKLSWPELVQQQDWAPDYASLLEEIGAILSLAARYLLLPDPAPESSFSDREDLQDRLEHARQQLSAWQVKLAQDVEQQGELQTRKTRSAFLTVGARHAVRGTILTDLRRMLDEVSEVVEIIAHPLVNAQDA